MIEVVLRSFVGGELDPRAQYRHDLQDYSRFVRRLSNMYILPTGGVTKREGLKRITDFNQRQFIAVASGNPVTPNRQDIEVTVLEQGSGYTTYRLSTPISSFSELTISLSLVANLRSWFTYLTGGSQTRRDRSVSFRPSTVNPLGVVSATFVLPLTIHSDSPTFTGTSTLTITKVDDTTIRVSRSFPASRHYDGSIQSVGYSFGSTFPRISGIPAVTTPESTLTPIPREDVRLVDFFFNNEQSYVFAIQRGRIHIIENGQYVVSISLPSDTLATTAQVNSLKWVQQADTILFLDKKPFIIKRIINDNNTVSWEFKNRDIFKNIPYYDGASTERTSSSTLKTTATSGQAVLTFSPSRPSGITKGQLISIDGSLCRVIRTVGNNKARVNILSTLPIIDIDDTIASERWSYRTGSIAAWSETDGFPTVGAFFEGRLWLGGTKRFPVHCWASVVNDYFNFNEGRKLADEMVEVELINTLNPIVDIKSASALHINTEGEEFSIGSPIETAGITPQSVFVRQNGNVGTKQGTRLFEVDNSLFYIQRFGESVRTISYSAEQGTFSSKVVGLLNAHLIRNPVDFAVRKPTNSVEGNRLFVVNDDGTMAVGTIIKSFNIIGFSLFTTEIGSITNVIVDKGIDVYVIIKKPDNTNHLYLFDSETIFDDERTFALPAGAALAVPAVDNPKDVIQDGEYLGRSINWESAVRTKDRDSTIKYGYTPVAVLTTLTPDFGAESSQSIVNKKKMISSCSLLLKNTPYVKVNGKEVRARTSAEIEDEGLLNGITVVRGIKGWNHNAQIEVVSDEPKPLTVEGITYTIHSGEEEQDSNADTN